LTARGPIGQTLCPTAVTDPWTIGRVSTWTARDLAARGVEGARLDAELLVAHALGLRRLDLYLRIEQPLNEAELAKIRALVERRRRREPVAYILGYRDFYNRRFASDARALVPRPETELVVEAALARLKARGDGPLRVLDLGTGTGAIAVTLALELATVTVDAVDLSEAALSLARENAAALGAADRVTFHHGSLYEPVGDARYDLVVSNPPYIPSAECDALMPDVALFEPRLALDGGDDGTLVLRALVTGAPAHLLPGGSLVVELGHDQGPAARALGLAAGFPAVAVAPDYARHDRVLTADLT
jgi:release factor glutamine methyltransferase